MFERIIRYVKLQSYLKSEQRSNFKKDANAEGERTIDKELEVNLVNLKSELGKSEDVIFREFCFGDKKVIKAFYCCIDGWADKKIVDDIILKPLMVHLHTTGQENELLSGNIYRNIKSKILNGSQFEDAKTYDEVMDAILSGCAALYIDGYDTVLIARVGTGGKTRGIEEPAVEVVVRGPHEGFTEELRTNTYLLRKRIRNPKLIFESFKIGQQTRTGVTMAYIDGIANKKIINEVRIRLNRIDTDAILESGYIEQFIEDHPLSPFATIGNSERPDKVAGKLLEGRVAILCEGTPVVLTVPKLFIENFQVSEDYYSRPYLSSLLRLFRFGAYFVTIMVPSLYVALETYHQEMIPTVLLITMAGSREGIPFPSFVETLIMIIMFELLRESGLRLPKQVGQAVSIVGALVIGQAAVQAGIISAPMVIIGSLTGITSFMVPSLLDSVIFFRFFLLFLSASFGLYGVVVGQLILLAHVCSLRSFGVPFLSPLAPTIWSELKDSFVRFPLWMLNSRPKSIAWKSTRRQESSLKPKKPKNNGGAQE